MEARSTKRSVFALYALALSCDALPLEVLSEIFRFFPRRMRLCISIVCKSWRRAVLRTITKLPQHTSDFARYLRHYPALTELDLAVIKEDEELPPLPASLRVLHISSEWWAKSASKIALPPFVTDLHIRLTPPCYEALPLLQCYGSTVRRLRLDMYGATASDAFGLKRLLAEAKLPHLESLALECFGEKFRSLDDIGPKFSAQLTHLDFNCNITTDFGVADFVKLKSLTYVICERRLVPPPCLVDIASQLSTLEIKTAYPIASIPAAMIPYVTALDIEHAYHKPGQDLVHVLSQCKRLAKVSLPSFKLQLGRYESLLTCLWLTSMEDLHTLLSQHSYFPHLQWMNVTVKVPDVDMRKAPSAATLGALHFAALNILRIDARDYPELGDTLIEMTLAIMHASPYFRHLQIDVPFLRRSTFLPLKDFLLAAQHPSLSAVALGMWPEQLPPPVYDAESKEFLAAPLAAYEKRGALKGVEFFDADVLQLRRNVFGTLLSILPNIQH